MNLFPAIDLQGGKVVRLTQGDYDRMTVYGEDPCAQARQFVEAGARYLHVVDLDGAKDGTLSNYGSIAALAKQGGLYLEVGGGIRTEERIEKYLSLGVDRCILGSVAVTDFDFTARMLKRYGERIAWGWMPEMDLLPSTGGRRSAPKRAWTSAGGWQMPDARPSSTPTLPVMVSCRARIWRCTAAGGRGAGRGLHGQRRHLVGGRAAGAEKDGHRCRDAWARAVYRGTGSETLCRTGAELNEGERK